ncbi:MAG: two component transcriptional regulator, LuxR family [Verrucomicrobiales bacterium]|nr:two component transcriptional regulator, LuxR family [Verrucomicrobiales bacterium]
MKSAQHIRVLIADDHVIVREGLRSTLADFANIKIVGEAKDGLEAIEKVRSLKPDVVLMDINMPRLNGLEATALIRKSFPKTKILVVTVHDSQQYITGILRAGADGYVVKDTSPDDLARAIESVYRGGSVFSPSVARHLVDGLVKSDGTAVPARITPREKQILSLLTKGKTNKEMAAALKLSVRSVETFRLRLMRKLKVSNAAELTKYALEHRLVE